MEYFSIDPEAVRIALRRASGLVDPGGGRDLLERLANDEMLSSEELTALFLDREVPTEAILDVARNAKLRGPRQIETFSPLYISNECDAECSMCGMRRFNEGLHRETADASTVREQLEILHRRGLRGVAILTGEYRHGAQRRKMLERSARAAREALELGFAHVLINIGSLEVDEYETLLAGLARSSDSTVVPQVTMCTFQETYDPEVYGRFMGTSVDNPRSDYARRLENFDRAADAGMRFANPGVLLGLNRDLAFELLALLRHTEHLQARGMQVYISIPRLRKANGAPHLAGVQDDEFYRFAAILSAGVPSARVVLSTREPDSVQQLLLPILGVLTPGSPGVAPYTEDGATFEVDASQFEVLDHRPIEAILDACLDAGVSVDCYVPAATSRHSAADEERSTSAPD